VSFGAGINVAANCMGMPCDTRFSDLVRSITVAVKNKNWSGCSVSVMGELGALEQGLIDANGGASLVASVSEYGGCSTYRIPCALPQAPNAVQSAYLKFHNCLEDKIAPTRGNIKKKVGGAIWEIFKRGKEQGAQSPDPIFDNAAESMDAIDDCFDENPLAMLDSRAPADSPNHVWWLRQ